MSAPFADEAAVSLRHLADKLIGLRPTRRFDDFFFGRIRPAIGNIFANCSREQQCVLQHDCDLRPQRFFRYLAHVTVIEHDRTARGIVKSRHQTQYSALTHASPAYEPDDLVWLDAKIDVAQDLAISRISKTYRLKRDGTVRGRNGNRVR